MECKSLQLEDTMRRKPRDWLAIDDYLHWPAWCRGKNIRTHVHEGIRGPAVLEELKMKLAEMY